MATELEHQLRAEINLSYATGETLNLLNLLIAGKNELYMRYLNFALDDLGTDDSLFDFLYALVYPREVQSKIWNCFSVLNKYKKPRTRITNNKTRKAWKVIDDLQQTLNDYTNQYGVSFTIGGSSIFGDPEKGDVDLGSFIPEAVYFDMPQLDFELADVTNGKLVEHYPVFEKGLTSNMPMPIQIIGENALPLFYAGCHAACFLVSEPLVVASNYSSHVQTAQQLILSNPFAAAAAYQELQSILSERVRRRS